MDKALIGIITLGIYVAFGFLLAWYIEWAWNTLVPTLLHGPTINYAEGCALYFTLSLIAGVFKKAPVKIDEK